MQWLNTSIYRRGSRGRNAVSKLGGERKSGVKTTAGASGGALVKKLRNGLPEAARL